MRLKASGLFIIKRFANYTDEELINLWQQGQHKAFDAIYERYFIKLVNIAWKKTGNPQASQELVQDVFVALHKQLPKLASDTSLDGYLFITLRNRIFNYHRSLAGLAKKQLVNQEPILPLIDETCSQLLETKELEIKLKEKIQTLPAQCRMVFLLSREESLSHKQIAERLNISVNTVEQHIRKALGILRNSLDGYNNVVVSLVLMTISTALPWP